MKKQPGRGHFFPVSSRSCFLLGELGESPFDDHAYRFVLEDGEGGISETASATVRVESVPSPVAVASESFDYSSGGLAGANGGYGWVGAWQDGIGIDGDEFDALQPLGNHAVDSIAATSPHAQNLDPGKVLHLWH